MTAATFALLIDNKTLFTICVYDRVYKSCSLCQSIPRNLLARCHSGLFVHVARDVLPLHWSRTQILSKTCTSNHREFPPKDSRHRPQFTARVRQCADNDEMGIWAKEQQRSRATSWCVYDATFVSQSRGRAM